ncbi:MAG TPA: hypothetical protein VMU55_03860, partial [Solirubrobacteraceae bacterium]|nr:hypothetical protein [Solirubrobacteraceae bacterium]
NGTKTALKAPRGRSKRIRERPKTRMNAGDSAMELARLELATSWVRCAAEDVWQSADLEGLYW